MVEISVETRTVEREFVLINGEEFPAGIVLDMLNNLEGTDGFMSGLRCSGLEADVADVLVDIGVVSHSNSAGYYLSDEELAAEIYEELLEAYE
jgi:hypothetical protein